MKDNQLAYYSRTWDYILRQAISLEQNAQDDFINSNFQIDAYNMRAMKDFRYHLEQAIHVAFEASNLLKNADLEPEI